MNTERWQHVCSYMCNVHYAKCEWYWVSHWVVTYKIVIEHWMKAEPIFGTLLLRWLPKRTSFIYFSFLAVELPAVIYQVWKMNQSPAFKAKDFFFAFSLTQCRLKIEYECRPGSRMINSIDTENKWVSVIVVMSTSSFHAHTGQYTQAMGTLCALNIEYPITNMYELRMLFVKCR